MQLFVVLLFKKDSAELYIFLFKPLSWWGENVLYDSNVHIFNTVKVSTSIFYSMVLQYFMGGINILHCSFK